jgi:hypothetical protein
MHVRFAFLAAAALAGTSAYAAEAPKAPVRPAAQPQTSDPAVVLASADSLRPANPADQQPATTPKRRIARVTTCRCGDPQATDTESQPEQ